MKITKDLLKKILVNSNLISAEDFTSTIEEAKERKEPLEDLLLEKGLITDEELGRLIADKTGYPFVNLRGIQIGRQILEIIPEIVAKKQKVIVFKRTKKGLGVATSDPDNLQIKEFIERKTGEQVVFYYATPRDILEALKHYRKEIKGEFEELIGKSLEEFEKIKTLPAQPLPIIKIIDLILNHGYENRTSDIHIEPYEKKTILRYRIDGVLHDVLALPRKIHDFLVARIKILAKLRTDIHEAAQDGRFSFKRAEEKVDVRTSVAPITEGEKVVLRLLSERARRFNLEDLGLGERDLEVVLRNIKKPWGMILVSGPTGCGKTTTLYAVLKILNKREVNVMTIEDPIEYDIEGVNQIQVNPKTNLTFAQGLRSIIRQDPDIIMVGEIRDKETASLAVNAAMTGHLLLSTFHSNDAPTTLPRLYDMGAEPFLIASTVNIVISQRLVRRICPKCIESYEASFTELVELLGKDLASRLPRNKKNKIMLFKGKGCAVCQKTGYMGRVGIFEVLEMQDPIRKLVMDKVDASQIKKAAQDLGMTTMIEDGLQKIERGLTTVEEIMRASKQ